MAFSLLGAIAMAEAAEGPLQKAKNEDKSLRADDKRVRLRHHVERVIEAYEVAVKATGGADRIEARRGEAEAWKLLAHWSGRADDRARAEDAVARWAAAKKKTSSEEQSGRPGPPPDKERVFLTRAEAATSASEVIIRFSSSGPFSSERNRIPMKAGRPARIYFDLEPMIASKEVMGPVAFEHAKLARVRVGQFDDDTVRVVIDYEDGVEPEVLPEIEGDRLRIGFGATLAAAVPREEKREIEPALPTQTSSRARALADELKATLASGVLDGIVSEVKEAYPEIDIDEEVIAASSDPVAAIEEPEVGEPVGLKRSTREATRSQAGTLLAIRRVVIDAGHGGKDHGAVGSGGTKEKDVNLAIAKKLGAELTKKGLKVVYTRTNDRFLSLKERSTIANKSGADLFISVHSNAHKRSRIHGIETYYLNVTSNRYAERLARRENSFDGDVEEGPEPDVGMSETEAAALPAGTIGQDLRLLLADLAMRSAASESRRLAGYVQGSLVGSLRRNYDDVRDLGVKHALFYVLLGTRMPSVLIETGFLTHGVEGKRLASDRYQDAVAQAIAAGVMRLVSDRARVAARLSGDEGSMGTLARAAP